MTPAQWRARHKGCLDKLLARATVVGEQSRRPL
jgi:hypothetical protein